MKASRRTAPSISLTRFLTGSSAGRSMILLGGLFSLGLVATPQSRAAAANEYWDSIFDAQGLDGRVYAIAVSGSDIYVGGLFDEAGGVTNLNNIAKWNGSTWVPLGGGVDDRVTSLVVNGTDVYVGGFFIGAGGVTGANYVAKWNGSTWSKLGTSVNDRVRALTMIGSNLYVGGDFTTAGGGSANFVARWNGTSWSGLGSGMDDWVFALATDGSNLYAGGDFTLAGGTTVNYLAKWNGSAWSAVGGGVDDRVDALLVDGSNIYAGGFFTLAGGSLPAGGLAHWNGSNWFTFDGGSGYSVNALGLVNNELFVGGFFGTIGGVRANNAAKWDGSHWWPLGSGANSQVSTIQTSGTNVYYGGLFTATGLKPAKYIGRWMHPAAPAAPSGLTAATASSTWIDLQWADNSTSEHGFKIESSPNGTTWTEIATAEANATKYTDKELNPNTTYYYRVRAYGLGGNSSYAGPANANTANVNTPENLIATTLSTTAIRLTWTDTSGNETGFKIERLNTGTGKWAEIATVDPNVTTYDDTGLTPVVTYYYRMRAGSAGGDSDYSNFAHTSTVTSGSAPAAPTGLSLLARSFTRVKLTWTDNADNEAGFEIWRAPAAEGPWTQIGTTGAGNTGFTDRKRPAGTTYYYTVRAYSVPGGSSADSNMESTNTGVNPTPWNLFAVSVCDDQVVLDWEDLSSTEDGYRVKRKSDVEDWAVIAELAPGVTRYIDTNLVAGTTYSYKIRGFGTAGRSDNSNKCGVTMGGGIAAVTQGSVAEASEAASPSVVVADSSSVTTNPARLTSLSAAQLIGTGVRESKLTEAGPGTADESPQDDPAVVIYALRQDQDGLFDLTGQWMTIIGEEDGFTTTYELRTQRDGPGSFRIIGDGDGPTGWIRIDSADGVQGFLSDLTDDGAVRGRLFTGTLDPVAATLTAEGEDDTGRAFALEAVKE